mgnify:CR=1 FL=1
MDIREFTIDTGEGIQVKGNLNPTHPSIDVRKDGGLLHSFRGRDAVAQFCQTSLVDILVLMSESRNEIESLKPVSDKGADVIPLNPEMHPDRFSLLEL